MDKQYHLIIWLEDCHFTVMREFLVPASIRLDLLHVVIQIVMGWRDLHLHAFHTENGDFTALGPNNEDERMKDERSILLIDVVNEDYPDLTYEYDFSGNWRHTIIVQSFNCDITIPHPIHCLKTQGACPPEGIGGPEEYKRFCEILNNPYQQDKGEMADWVYGICNYPKRQKWPDGVSVEAINEILHKIEYEKLKPVKRKKIVPAKPSTHK